MSQYGMVNTRMTEEQLSKFYEEPTNNFLNLEKNQYLVIESATAEGSIPPYYWDGERFRQCPFRDFRSKLFGDIKPLNGDPYQLAYMDSLVRNQLTFATGPAGSGKSLLALAYAMQELEQGKVSKIIVFTNALIAKGAAKLGFYPGDKNDKLLDSQIGNILTSKLGGRMELEKMIYRDEIQLIPIGDSRGFETPPDSFVYFTEAQNTDKYLMKLFLQRINDDSKVVVEGDFRQVDIDELFANGKNGLRRAIEVFTGKDYAGHVELKHILRSRIARDAEEI